MAPYLRGEIAHAAKSAEGFRRDYGASVNNLRNMCNGHRVTDFATQALVLSVAGSTRLPNEAAVAKAIVDAATRSAPRSGVGARTMRFEGVSDSSPRWNPSEPSAPSHRGDVPTTHPNAALIRRVLARVLRNDPLVSQYEAAGSDRAGKRGELSCEVSVFVADSPHEAGAEGFIAPGVIAGRLWVPGDWKASVHARGGGVLDGVFVCSAIEGSPKAISQFRGIRVFAEAGESPEEWDLAFAEKVGLVETGRKVRWVSQ